MVHSKCNNKKTAAVYNPDFQLCLGLLNGSTNLRGEVEQTFGSN
jgi:hypothetical protein